MAEVSQAPDLSAYSTTSQMNSALAAAKFGVSAVLWRKLGADMNSTADQVFTKAFSFSNFTLDKLIVSNASTSLTLSVGGLYGAASKSAPILFGAATVYSPLSSSTKVLTVSPTSAGSDLLALANIYLSLTTGQGSAATADFSITGIAWS